MEHVNWLSLLIATVIPMVIGFAYYHPKTFGTAWMNSLGFTEEDLKKGNMPVTFGVSLVMSFFLAFFLIFFNNSPGQEGEFDSFGHGAFHGVFLAIVVGLPILITNGLFEMKNWKTLLIDAIYWIIALALMGGVLDVMNHWPNEYPGC